MRMREIFSVIGASLIFGAVTAQAAPQPATLETDAAIAAAQAALAEAQAQSATVSQAVTADTRHAKSIQRGIDRASDSLSKAEAARADGNLVEATKRARHAERHLKRVSKHLPETSGQL